MNKALLFILCLFGFIAGVYAEEITVSFDISGWYPISSTFNSNYITSFSGSGSKVTLTFNSSGSGATASIKSNNYGYYINISHPSDDTFIVSTNKITQITINGQTVQIMADEQDNEIKIENGTWVNTRLENSPARAPIPPIAIALILITMPIIALRKLN